MSENPMVKAALLMTVIVLVVVLGVEMSLSHRGIENSYDDGPPLWSNSRAEVYGDPERTVVFIGSSRIKFDLNIEVWEKLTGAHAVQLAVEGSNPRPALYDLADDPNFKGRLVVDVTEGLFFSNAPPNIESFNKNIQYFHEQTPAQKASFQINRVVEPCLVLLDKENLSFNARLDALEIPSRPGVFMMPIFPMEFSRPTFRRETRMTERFVSDSSLQQQVKDIWAFFASFPHKPMPAGELDSIFSSVKVAVQKIKSRGGDVVFVRTPSSDPMLTDENKAFPREQFWERLLKETNSQGIHFADYEPINHFVCPELSHLSPQDAVVFTRHFADILVNETPWRFPSLQTQTLR